MVEINQVPGLGTKLKSSEDVLNLKKFLESLTDEELEKIAMDQVNKITEQYLVVNRAGSAFGRIIIDGTMQGINYNRFEAAGYTLYPEKPFSGNLTQTVNYCSDSYWSCNCKDYYIHHRNQIKCKLCGCDKDVKRCIPIEELKLF